MTGRVWTFGDDIDTDALAPGAYMKAPLAELARHCLEDIDPGFAAGAATGDLVVAGRNFGMGSSREQAAEALKALGIAAVLAESFAGIFYRNALNLGLPALTITSQTRDGLAQGCRASIDVEAGTVTLEDGTVLPCEPIPPALMAMVRAGGLVPWLERRLKGGG